MSGHYNHCKVVGRSFLVFTALMITACSPAEQPAPRERATEAPAAASKARDVSSAPTIVILGDSLTAGLGLDPSEAYPTLLQKHLDNAGYRFEVVNAGVSGDTTAGGLRRLEWSIDANTKILVVALGGNDGLRGLPVRETRDNLEKIIERAQQRRIAVVLAGMEAPPNYGPVYTAEFRQLYRDLAEEQDVALIPFLLQGVAGVPALNQPDGIHPNPEGARIVEKLVWSAIEPIVGDSATR